jgi:hypothetical protein
MADWLRPRRLLLRGSGSISMFDPLRDDKRFQKLGASEAPKTADKADK